jgi:hypothetical protein
MTDYFDLSNAQVVNDPEEEQYVHDVNTAAIQEAQQDSLDKKAAQEAAVKSQEQAAKQKADEEKNSVLNKAGELVDNTLFLGPRAAGLGVGDFISDVAGLVPLTKGIDEWWDKTAVRSDNGIENAVRDAASVIVPTLVGGAGVIRGATLATKGLNIAKRTQLIGRLAAAAGVDTAVTAISSTSERDDNIAGALNKWLGWDIPWATRDGDSPDVKRQKNIMEAAGLSGATSLIEAAFALKKGATKLVPKDPIAAQAVEAKAAREAADEDPIVSAVQNRDAMREQAVTQEAIRRVDVDLDGGYDPFINNYYEAQQRGVNNVEIDPLQAKVDHWRIQNNEGTLNGRATSAVSDNVMEFLSGASRGSERADLLEDVWLSAAPSADVTIQSLRGARKIPAAEINKSVDSLVNNVLNPDVSFDQFKDIVKQMRRDSFNSKSVLDEPGWVMTSQAFKRAFDEVYNPNNLRASALIVQNAADNVADTIRAANLIGDVADTSRQQELILKKLQTMAGEMKVISWIRGSGLEFLKFKKGKKSPEEIAAWLATRADEFDQVVANKAAAGAEFVQKYTTIAKENPEFLKPFNEIYDFTNGNVDDLYKLHRYMEDRVGVVSKAFIDGNPEVPSAVVQGAQATRYNNILSGLSAVRAATGNAVLLAAKPISVLAGAAATGDAYTFKKALAGFSGIGENLQRAFKHMGDEWRAVNASPEVIAARGRSDLSFGQYDDFTAIEAYAQSKWANSSNPGDMGRLAAWNIAKVFHAFNKNNIVRWGVNAMHAVDGFTNSMIASMNSRFKAYDEMFQATKGTFDEALFNQKQRELYSKVFDNTGLITDEAVSFASKEISLNLDSEMVAGLENFMKHVPIAKSLFMFPKTGLNGLEMAWSFNPLSSVGLAMGRVRRAFKAQTPDEIMAVLQEHGIKVETSEAEQAFKSLKSEYVGRQLMGSAVVMGAGLWALAGNLTGNGPQDGAERKRMQDMGAKFNSIKVGDQWISYKGFEPFDSLLSLVGDIVYQSTRVDQAVTEDWFRKVSFAISMNVANKTFLSGFEPLVSMLSGDEGAWNRFLATQADSMIPGTGARSLLSQAVTPQLKDVENDVLSYLKNRNKFLYNGNDELKNLVDVYTGEPIRYNEPLVAAGNSLMPFFKSNGGMEPWRQWLLSTGWDNLQTIRTNKITGQPLTAEERFWINNWIGQNGRLAEQIEGLRTANDGWWDKKLTEYAKARGLKNQKEFPIKETVVHDMLDQIHNEAFNQAWSAWEQNNATASNLPGYYKELKGRLNIGDTAGAAKTSSQLQQILDIRN